MYATAWRLASVEDDCAADVANRSDACFSAPDPSFCRAAPRTISVSLPQPHHLQVGARGTWHRGGEIAKATQNGRS